MIVCYNEVLRGTYWERGVDLAESSLKGVV